MTRILKFPKKEENSGPIKEGCYVYATMLDNYPHKVYRNTDKTDKEFPYVIKNGDSEVFIDSIGTMNIPITIDKTKSVTIIIKRGCVLANSKSHELLEALYGYKFQPPPL